MRTNLRYSAMIQTIRNSVATVAMLLGIILCSHAQTISAVTPSVVNPAEICAGSNNFSVSFQVTNGTGGPDHFDNGTVYTILLSDPSGSSFPTTLTTATNITGPSGNGNSGTITVSGITIPANTVASNSYKVQVTSSLPTAISSVSFSNFTIRNITLGFNGPNITVFKGSATSIGTTGVPLNTYSWSLNPTGGLISNDAAANPIVTPIVNTLYTLTENAGACGTNRPVGTVNLTVKDNLFISKTASFPSTPKPGDDVSYTITYSNNNPATAGAANNVTISDLLPNANLFTYTGATSSPALGAPSISGQTLSWNLASIAANTTGTITISGKIGRTGWGPAAPAYDAAAYYIRQGGGMENLENTASISNAISPVVNSNTTLNPVTQSCGVNMPAALDGSIKTATNSEAYYVITLTNSGNIKDAFDLTSFNTLATGTGTPQSSALLTTTLENFAGVTITQTPWLIPGESYTFVVHMRTPPGTPPTMTNYTRITATSRVCASAGSTLITTGVSTGSGGSNDADIQILTQASPSTVIAGNVITYTLTVQNFTGNHAKNILILDTIPSNVTYVGNQTLSNTDMVYSYTAASREVRVTYLNKNLSSGTSPSQLVVTFQVMTQCSTVPSVSNRAYVSNSTGGDANANNNVSTAVVAVDPYYAIPDAYSMTVCAGQSVTINPNNLPSGRGYRWYSTETGGTMLSQGPTYSAGILTDNLTVYLAQYNLTATDCESFRRAVTVYVTKDVTFNTHPVNKNICNGESTTFSVAATNGGTLTYQWQVSTNSGSNWSDLTNTGIYNGSTTATLSLSAPAESFSGYQYRCVVTAPSCFTKTSNAAILTVKKSNTWLGVNTNWMDVQNWCLFPSTGTGLPTSTTNVTIPAGAAFYPIITQSSGVEAADIGIQAGANIVINSGAKLDFYGNLNNLGTITNNGTLAVRGTDNSFPGSGTIAAMSILEINKNGSGNIATLNKAISISTELKPTQGTLHLADFNVTLSSTATKTAFVSAVNANANFTYGNGRFVVERYISQTRRWQLLSVPALTTQTIRQSWQENGINIAGQGVNITGPGANPGTNGLDAVSGGYSMKTYSPAIDDYVSVSNTLTPLQNPAGYYLFVYGDRNSNANGANGVPTKLRTTGKLFVGRNGHPENPPAFSANSYAWHAVGNPFASPVDFELWRNNNANISSSFQVWDPSVTTKADGYASGAYQTITYSGSSAIITPGSSFYPATGDKSNGFIQSGQAFFVERTGNINLPFLESHKAVVDRLVNRGTAESAGELKMFSTMLLFPNNLVADGNRVLIADEYSNALDNRDAGKLTNANASFGMDRGDRWLSVETRQSIQPGDTIHYSMGGLWDNNYRLAFAPQNIANPMLKAELVDRYTNSRTAVSLTDSSYVDITLDNNEASRAYNRFYLVFSSQNITVLPVSFIDVKANRRADRSIDVQWKVANELNIDRYEIERSADGLNFNGIIKGDATNSIDYTKTDLSPLAFDNFYRIKAIGRSGDITYSKTVKVSQEQAPATIVISPNPVKNGLVQMKYQSMEPGSYSVEIVNPVGQILQLVKINISANSNRQTIRVKGIPTGFYHISIRNQSNEIMHQEKIMFE